MTEELIPTRTILQQDPLVAESRYKVAKKRGETELASVLFRKWQKLKNSKPLQTL